MSKGQSEANVDVSQSHALAHVTWLQEGEVQFALQSRSGALVMLSMFLPVAIPRNPAWQMAKLVQAGDDAWEGP